MWFSSPTYPVATQQYVLRPTAPEPTPQVQSLSYSLTAVKVNVYTNLCGSESFCATAWSQFANNPLTIVADPVNIAGTLNVTYQPPSPYQLQDMTISYTASIPIKINNAFGGTLTQPSIVGVGFLIKAQLGAAPKK